MARKLAVIGAGLMGSGIAQVSAQAGWDVVLRDVTDEALTRGTDGIKASYDKFVTKGKLDAGRRRGGAGAHHHDHRPGRRRRRRHRRRGRLREARGQARDLPRARQARAGRRRARLQHLRHPDHQDRGGHRAPGAGRRRALLLAGADDAAVRTGARLQDERRNARHRAGVRRVRRQDLHRRQPRRRRLRHHPSHLGAGRRGGQARTSRASPPPRTSTSPASWASATRWDRWPPPT